MTRPSLKPTRFSHQFVWEKTAQNLTFETSESRSLKEVFSANSDKSGLLAELQFKFQGYLDAILVQEEAGSSLVQPSQVTDATKSTTESQEPRLLPLLPKDSMLTKKLLPKEIIYGLASEDAKRKFLTLKLSAEAICDPSFALAGEFEEVLSVFLSLNLNEFQNSKEGEVTPPTIWYGKGLTALFVYNPALFIE